MVSPTPASAVPLRLNRAQIQDLLLRRRWWFLLPCLLGWGLVLTLHWWLPARYSSQALLLLERQAVPQAYVQPNVNFDASQLLQTLGQQVLSRDRLAEIVRDYHLYPDVVNRQGMDAAVDRLRAAITLAPVNLVSLPNPPPGEWSAVRIAFQASSPELAQSVANRITTMFIQENLRATQQASSDTTDFLTEQLQQAQQQLQQAQQQVQEYERAHLGELPAQGADNLAMVMSLQTALNDGTTDLNRTRQEIATDQSLLAQTPSPARAQLQQQLINLQAQLRTLRSQYTERYPDVERTEAQIAALQVQLASPPAALSAAPSPETAELRSRLQAAQALLPRQQAQVTRLQQQLASYQQRLTLAPLPAAQLAGLQAQDQQAQARYQQLADKLGDSQMASQLEQRQGGAQFSLVNAPDLPQQPVWPQPAWLVGIGAAVGVGLGLALSVLAEVGGDTLAGEQDLVHLGVLPILVSIPPLYSRRARARRRRRYRWEGLAATAAAVLLLAANVWLLRQG